MKSQGEKADIIFDDRCTMHDPRVFKGKNIKEISMKARIYIMGKIIAVCTSAKKGMRKKNVGEGVLKVGFVLEGDAHGGDWHRMVSLLAMESIKTMIDKGLDVGPGDFAENLTTEGLELFTLPIGTKLKIGETSIGEVTQIGKECHAKCAIFYQAGDCVMPKEGIFIRLLEGGVVRVGDSIEVMA